MEQTNNTFIIFNVSEIDKIDFSQVKETSAETIRKSLDGTKTFVKWDTIEPPSFLDELITKEGPYTYDEIIEILNTDDWKYVIPAPIIIQEVNTDTQYI